MAKIILTRAVMLEGALMPPDWYELTIKDMKTLTKNGNTLYFCRFTLDSHPQKPEVEVMYNSFSMPKFAEMYAASQQMTVEELVAETDGEVEIDTENLEGRTLRGQLVHEIRKDTGETKNQFANYLPSGDSNPL